MRGFPARTDVAEVWAWIDAWPAPLPGETVPLAVAAGRVLAEEVVAARDLPAFARASMDGWAVEGRSTFGASPTDPVDLPLVGEVRTGEAPPHPLSPGGAMRIRTGAPLPEGADAVLPAEQGEEVQGRLRVTEAVPPGRHVGRVGEDVARGSVALPAGRRLRPQDVALLSALGRAELHGVRKPHVAVLITGSEVRAPGSVPGGYAVADANGPLLEALVRRDGGVPFVRGPYADDDPRLETDLVGVQADLVLVTGASSVGPEDRVPEIVARRGRLVLHGVALRPASPTGLGVLAGRPVLLLPGNPVSALCAYDLFAGRLLRRLAGRDPALPYRNVRLPLARKVVSQLGRMDVLRVRVEGGLVEPLTARGAGVLSTTTRADGFVLVPPAVEGWPEGAPVDVHLYDLP